MGLFDRFRKKDEKGQEKLLQDTDKVIAKANNFIDEAQKVEDQKKIEETQKHDKRVARLTKQKEYEVLKKKLATIKKLSDERKIKIQPEALNRLNEWFSVYQGQMVNYNYYDVDTPDLVIPTFPISASDIFFPKNKPVLSKALEDLLDYSNVYMSSNFSIYEEFFEVIKDDDELISVSDAIDLSKESGRHR